MKSDLPLRQTKLVCTIGPSCWDEKTLDELIAGGMNIARLNFSHGERSDHQKIIDRIRATDAYNQGQIAIMLDTQGAEIRTGDVKAPIEIEKGQEVLFSSTASGAEQNGRTVVEVSYDKFANDVVETNVILIDNGELSFDILSIEPDGSVIGKARESGSIGTRRHINLPGADIDLPSITEKDWEDIAFGAEQNLDFLALSFIRNAEEVKEVRAMLEKMGSDSKIVSKIETQKAVKNIREITESSDGIMVARGDLGADVPFEKLPAIQDEIVCRCRDGGKPVIIATHMLESMKKHPMPTRAEVTDVAHAVDTGVDATMLSGETASGKLPVQSVDAMTRIHRATELHMKRLKTAYQIRFHDSAEEEMDEAVARAEEEEIDAFVVLTETGRTAKHISKFRFAAPIITLVKSPEIARSLALHYGVYPVVVEFDSDDDITMKNGIDLALKAKLLSKKQKVMQLKDRARNIEVTVL